MVVGLALGDEGRPTSGVAGRGSCAAGSHPVPNFRPASSGGDSPRGRGHAAGRAVPGGRRSRVPVGEGK